MDEGCVRPLVVGRLARTWGVLHDDVFDLMALQQPLSALDHRPLPAFNVDLRGGESIA